MVPLKDLKFTPAVVLTPAILDYNRFSSLGTTIVPSGNKTAKYVYLINPLIVSGSKRARMERNCPKFLRF
jgi:hypothetical protein